MISLRGHDGFSKLNLLTISEIPLIVFGNFDTQHNGWAEVEHSHLLTLSHSDPFMGMRSPFRSRWTVSSRWGCSWHYKFLLFKMHWTLARSRSEIVLAYFRNWKLHSVRFSVSDVVFIFVISLHGDNFVSVKCLIEMECHWSNVSCTNVSHCEESVSPFSQQTDSFVVFESVFMLVDPCWLHGV